MVSTSNAKNENQFDSKKVICDAYTIILFNF